MSIIRITVHGRVQGLFFRATTKEVADRLMIRGWVKNSGSSQVEILAVGADEALQEFKAWCMKGPALAKVEKIDFHVPEDNPDLTAFNSFDILNE